MKFSYYVQYFTVEIGKLLREHSRNLQMRCEQCYSVPRLLILVLVT
jgi:hypothetical protein